MRWPRLGNPGGGDLWWSDRDGVTWDETTCEKERLDTSVTFITQASRCLI